MVTCRLEGYYFITSNIRMNFDFTSLSSIKSLSYSQYIYKRDCWNTWNRIESSNSNVSTAHGMGDYTWPYYSYIDQEEKIRFEIGLSLHVQYIGGYIPINPVQKN